MRQFAGALIGATFGVGTFMLHSSGFFTDVIVEETKVPERKIVFFEHQGISNEVGPVFRKLIKDSSPFLRVHNIIRITYDDPDFIQDQKQARSIIGLTFENATDENGATLLCTQKKEYRRATLPSTECLSTKYSMNQKNLNLAFFAIKQKVYPALDASLAKQKIIESNRNRRVEIFKFDESRNPYEIEFFVPTGSLAEQYSLHSKPTPQQAILK